MLLESALSFDLLFNLDFYINFIGMLLGKVIHQFKKWAKSDTGLSFTQFLGSHKKNSAVSLIGGGSTWVTALSGGLIDIDTWSGVFASFGSGYTLDSALNKSPSKESFEQEQKEKAQKLAEKGMRQWTPENIAKIVAKGNANYQMRKTSLDLLEDVDPRMALVVKTLSLFRPVRVLEGFREKKRQEELVKSGASQTMNSKHCLYPAQAVDIVPDPMPATWGDKDVKDLAEFYILAMQAKTVGDLLGISIRTGADWDGDYDLQDQSFDDIIHIELKTDDAKLT